VFNGQQVDATMEASGILPQEGFCDVDIEGLCGQKMSRNMCLQLFPLFSQPESHRKENIKIATEAKVRSSELRERSKSLAMKGRKDIPAQVEVPIFLIS